MKEGSEGKWRKRMRSERRGRLEEGKEGRAERKEMKRKKEKGTEKCERRKHRGQREKKEKRAGATIDDKGGLLAVCRHMTWARAGMRSVRVSFPPPPAIASWVTCGRVVS